MSQIIAALRRHAVLQPDAPALVGEHSALTWRELHEQVRGLSAKLQGVGSLGLLLGNSLQWVIADLAALATGITCVPVPHFFSPDQVRHALQDAAVDHVICEHAEAFGAVSLAFGSAELSVAGKSLHLLKYDYQQKTSHAGIAKITYTSGTTGSPKGVPLSLPQIETVASSLFKVAEGSEEDRALVLLPLSTLLENVGSVYIPVLAGACILVPDAASLGFHGSSRVDAASLGQKLQQLQPTTAILVPHLLKLFIVLAEQQMLPDSFRFIAVGGAPVSASQLAQAKNLSLPVYQGYGMSEAASVVTMNGIADNRPGSVGKPLPHCRMRIADDGEIMLFGTAFHGYVHDQGHVDREWFASGDLGYRDEDGYLFVNGRKREVIITAYGRNVSPEWVESELLTEASIAQAAVFGNGQPFLSAVIVPAAGQEQADIQHAINRVNLRLPDYARVQQHVLAPQPFLPQHGELTANGRPRRKQIEAHYQDLLSASYERKHEHVL